MKVIPELGFSKDNRIVIQLGKFDNGGFIATDMYTKKTGAIGMDDSALLALSTQVADLIARTIAGTIQPGPEKGLLLHVQLLPNTLGLVPINLPSNEKPGLLNYFLKLMLFAGSTKELPLKDFAGHNMNDANQTMFSPIFGELNEEALKNNKGFIIITPEQAQAGNFGGYNQFNNPLNFIEADVEVTKGADDRTKLTGKNK